LQPSPRLSDLTKCRPHLMLESVAVKDMAVIIPVYVSIAEAVRTRN
jgi:hypothetical protein